MSYVDVLANDAVRNLVMPISVAQYHQYCAMDSGLLKTELIEGVIFRKMSRLPLHVFVPGWLHNIFLTNLPPGYLVRTESPLTLVDSEPEPDVAIVKGELRDFDGQHPDYATLVVDVAISSKLHHLLT